MTLRQVTREGVHLARCHWWNGAGLVVVFFLVATFIWSNPSNDYLLYAALIIVGAHAYLSTLSFGRERKDREHRQEIAVAYRQQQLAVRPIVQEIPRVQYRPPQQRPVRSRPPLVALPG